MMSRAFVLAAISAIAILLAGCDGTDPAPAPDRSAEVRPAAAPATPDLPVDPPAPAAPPPKTTPTPSAAAGRSAPRLGERRDPARVLRAYASALHARDWASAARFWGRGSGVTAATLKAAYDRAVAPVLDIGQGSSDAGAGSIYYEAPVALRFGGDAPPERGTLLLRRVNDVPGASEDQLRWHIERSTIGSPQ